MYQDHKKLERLFMFSEVAGSLNFTEAAKNLAISKGYLSAQIKQLEVDLKTPLLVRTTRSVRLTQAGKQVFEDFKHIRTSLLTIERNLATEQQAIAGTIRITAPKQFAQSVLLPLCRKFSNQYPQVHFLIDSSYTRYDLVEHDFDLAFRATTSPPDNMIAKQLLTYHYAVVTSNQYLERFGKPETIDDLMGHNCLTGESQSQWQFSNGQQIKVSGNIQINDNLILRELTIAGDGIARLPSYFVEAALANHSLIELFPEYRGSGQAIYVLQPQLVYSSARVECFVNFVQDVLIKK